MGHGLNLKPPRPNAEKGVDNVLGNQRRNQNSTEALPTMRTPIRKSKLSKTDRSIWDLASCLDTGQTTRQSPPKDTCLPSSPCFGQLATCLQKHCGSRSLSCHPVPALVPSCPAFSSLSVYNIRRIIINFLLTNVNILLTIEE